MDLLLPIVTLKGFLPLLAIIAGVFVITTKNAIISVFNLIVLYILVAYYLIYIVITYIGISYIIIYIGAIAILFLFIIMMIDIEVVEKRSNNYLPLLFLLLSGFLIVLKKILYNLGFIKIKTLCFEEKLYEKYILFNIFESSESFNENKGNIIVENVGNDIDVYYRENMVKKLYENWNVKYSDNIDNINFSKLSPSAYNSSNILSTIHESDSDNNYLLIIPDWDSATNRITQISAIGDVLYTVYHSYIYILSVILLLGMVGAIILTADTHEEIKVISIAKHKKSSLLYDYIFINIIYGVKIIIYSLLKKLHYIFIFFWNNLNHIINKKNYYMKEKSCFCFNSVIKYTGYKKNKLINTNKYNSSLKYNNNIYSNTLIVPSFYDKLNMDNIYSEDIMGNLTYFIVANIIIAILLLVVNSYFSLSIKYLEKGGGFECGFTSFVQTRERFNVIFYRVSLLFLVFDLEIILAFPYTVIYQKNQNISKNNIIAFLYILIVGFIYELKEGALNIVKKARLTEINTIK